MAFAQSLRTPEQAQAVAHYFERALLRCHYRSLLNLGWEPRGALSTLASACALAGQDRVVAARNWLGEWASLEALRRCEAAFREAERRRSRSGVAP